MDKTLPVFVLEFITYFVTSGRLNAFAISLCETTLTHLEYFGFNFLSNDHGSGTLVK